MASELPDGPQGLTTRETRSLAKTIRLLLWPQCFNNACGGSCLRSAANACSVRVIVRMVSAWPGMECYTRADEHHVRPSRRTVESQRRRQCREVW